MRIPKVSLSMHLADILCNVHRTGKKRLCTAYTNKLVCVDLTQVGDMARAAV